MSSEQIPNFSLTKNMTDSGGLNDSEKKSVKLSRKSSKFNKKKNFSSTTHKESFKSEVALEEEYNIILNTIREKDNEVDITTYINNPDMLFYLKNNSVDYYLYKAAIKNRKFSQMK